jgi:PFU (PLAA family ubiquitin binding)
MFMHTLYVLQGSLNLVLCMSKGDDPYKVSETFCELHDLDKADYIPQIVFFIQANGLA